MTVGRPFRRPPRPPDWGDRWFHDWDPERDRPREELGSAFDPEDSKPFGDKQPVAPAAPVNTRARNCLECMDCAGLTCDHIARTHCGSCKGWGYLVNNKPLANRHPAWTPEPDETQDPIARRNAELERLRKNRLEERAWLMQLAPIDSLWENMNTGVRIAVIDAPTDYGWRIPCLRLDNGKKVYMERHQVTAQSPWKRLPSSPDSPSSS